MFHFDLCGFFSPIVNHQATNMVPHDKKKVMSDSCVELSPLLSI